MCLSLVSSRSVVGVARLSANIYCRRNFSTIVRRAPDAVGFKVDLCDELIRSTKVEPQKHLFGAATTTHTMAEPVRPRPAGVFEDTINAVALRLPTACVCTTVFGTDTREVWLAMDLNDLWLCSPRHDSRMTPLSSRRRLSQAHLKKIETLD